MRPRPTLDHAAPDPEGSLPRGHFRRRGRPCSKAAPAGATPLPSPRGRRALRTPAPDSPLPHLTWPRGARSSTAQVRPSRRADPAGPPALAPARPPGGLSRVAAARLAVPRPASLQRHRAGPNRHPARQPGRVPAPPRTSRRSPAEPGRRSAAPAAPSPTPARFHHRSSRAPPRVPRRRALPALTSRERTDSTRSARREPNRCLRARCCRRRLYRRRRCCTRVLVRRRRLPTDQPSSPVTAAQACYLAPPPSTPALRKRTDLLRSPPSLPPTHPVTRRRDPAPRKAWALPTGRKRAGAPVFHALPSPLPSP